MSRYVSFGTNFKNKDVALRWCNGLGWFPIHYTILLATCKEMGKVFIQEPEALKMVG
jgi:hypothetical protein